MESEIGAYMKKLIGHGQWGNVYLIERDTQVLALKVSHPLKEARSHLLREFHILSQLSHPSIVKVLDFGYDEEGNSFFTMEYVEGKPFSEAFEGYTPEILDALLKTLDALAYIHEKGLIHGDIKPDNLLVTTEKGGIRVKLLDFGFAGDLKEGGSRGSIGYMAPEILKGQEPDVRSDLYSLGVVLYESVTGRPPFVFKKIGDLFKRQRTGSFTPIRELNPEVPEPLAKTIETLISPLPDLRPSSAYEIALTLLPLIEKKSPEVRISSMRSFLTPPLVGRDDILKELKRSLKSPKKSGRALFLEGVQGIGKSRLLREFKHIAQTSGYKTFWIGLSERKGESSPLFSFLTSKLAKKPGDAEGGKYRMFEALLRGLAKISGKKRPVILIDDLQLASNEDLALLRYLVLSLATFPFLIVSTLHQDSLNRMLEEFKISGHAEVIGIEPLDEASVLQFVRGVLGKGTHLELLAKWLHRGTGGNPLLIFETLRSLRDQGIIRSHPSGWKVYVDELEALEIPKKIEEHFENFINGLPKESLEILKAASIAYVPLREKELIELTSLPEGVLYPALERLINQRVLVRFDEQQGLQWNSHHLRDSIFSHVSREEASRWHRKLADILLERYHREKDPSLLFGAALHLRELRAKRKAFETLLNAYQVAKEIQDIPKALDFVESAYKLRKKELSPREAIHLLTEQAELNSYLGEEEEALNKLKEALRLSERHHLSERADILVKLGSVMVKRGNANAALRYLSSFLQQKGIGDAKLRFSTLYNLTWVAILKNDLQEAEKTIRRFDRLLSQLSPAEHAKFLNLWSTLCWKKGDNKRAVSLAMKAKKVLEEWSPFHRLMAKVLHNLGKYAWHAGDLKEAEAYFLKTLEIQEKTFDLFGTAYTHSSLGLICYHKGDTDAARIHFEEALKLIQKIGNPALFGDISTNLAGVLEAKGELESALQYLDRAERFYELGGVSANAAIVYINKGGLLEKRGDFSRALEEYKKGLKLASRSKELHWENWALIDTMRVLRILGDMKGLTEVMRKLEKNKKAMDTSQRIAYLSERFELSLSKHEKGMAEQILKEVETIGKEEREDAFSAHHLIMKGKFLALEGLPKEALENLRKGIHIFKKINLFYEAAQGQLTFAETSIRAIESGEDIKTSYTEINSALEEAEGIFKKLGSKSDLDSAISLKDRLLKIVLSQSHRPPQRYLQTLYQISEITNLYLDRADFFDALLEKVIRLTAAERGALFLIDDGEFFLAASKDMDQATLTDAKDFSHSILKEASRQEAPILSSDALNDPRFAYAQSIKLNNIRSILVTRLTTRNRLIGVLYLDSRLSSDLFKEEEVEFLTSVSHILAATIDKTLAYRKLEERLINLKEGLIIDSFPEKIIAYSPKMVECLRSIEQVAPTDTSVLLMGETGTGKSVLARLIHEKSGRKGPFVRVELGNLSDTLFESELFGYARGAFTGAYQSKKGLLEEASQGTLFLDEITNIPLSIQAKLLTVIEEKVFRRLGEVKERKADFRVVCATNKDINKEVRSGRFREDLFYRLSSWMISVPPLRERIEDIPALAEIFINFYNEEFGKDVKGLTSEALEVLVRYPWPGNIRELKNAIERAVLLTQATRIDVVDLGHNLLQSQRETLSLKVEQKTLEVNRVKEALTISAGNVTKAAGYLGIRREQMYRLMKRYHLDPRKFRKTASRA